MNKILTIIGLVLVALPAVSQRQTAHTRKANELYKERKFDKALAEYRQSLNVQAADPILNFNTGNAYYRNEKYEQAVKHFEQPLAAANDSSLRQRSFYNKGVALSRQNKLEESIVAYKNAVKMDPTDVDARINLQKALLELKKKQPAEQQKKESDQNKRDKKKNNQQKQPPKSKLSQKQVEQLLKALQQREQQVQQKMQQNRNRSGGKPDKDW